jgi:hypothetical protein
VRLAQYEIASADAFGTNLFSVMLLFVADLAYAGGPILNEVDRFSLLATLLGILLKLSTWPASLNAVANQSWEWLSIRLSYCWRTPAAWSSCSSCDRTG